MFRLFIVTPPGGPGGPWTITMDFDEISPTADLTKHSYSPASAKVVFKTTK